MNGEMAKVDTIMIQSFYGCAECRMLRLNVATLFSVTTWNSGMQWIGCPSFVLRPIRVPDWWLCSTGSTRLTCHNQNHWGAYVVIGTYVRLITETGATTDTIDTISSYIAQDWDCSLLKFWCRQLIGSHFWNGPVSNPLGWACYIMLFGVVFFPASPVTEWQLSCQVVLSLFAGPAEPHHFAKWGLGRLRRKLNALVGSVCCIVFNCVLLKFL